MKFFMAKNVSYLNLVKKIITKIPLSLSDHEVYGEIWFKNSPEIRFNQNNSSTLDNFQNF